MKTNGFRTRYKERLRRIANVKVQDWRQTMTVELSYLVDKTHVEPRFSTVRRTIPEFVSDGVLVPDMRLQAAANAWREYQAIQSQTRTLNEQEKAKNKLHDLLNVFAEETNNDT